MTNNKQQLWSIDWINGRFQHKGFEPSPDSKNDINILVAGDWAPNPEQQLALLSNPPKFYGDSLPLFEKANFSIMNVEAPIRGSGTTIVKDGPNLAMDTQVVSHGLSALKLSLACLANNHIMDYGNSGLTTTLDTLHAASIETIGAGENLTKASQPVVTCIQDINIAVINVAEGEEAQASYQGPGVAPLHVSAVCDQIKLLLLSIDLSIDVVIVIAHAGREYVPVPPPYLRVAYRRFADAGASIVIGHHPHVPQGIEIWNGVPILYSLGNFVFRTTPNVEHRNMGYLVQIEVAKNGVKAFELKPYNICNDGLVILNKESQAHFLDQLRTISDYIASPHAEEFWDAYADLWWQIQFPKEMQLFAMQLSPQNYAEVARIQLATKALNAKGLQRFVLRAAHRLLRLGIRALPTQQRDNPQIAAAMRNRFDTAAHAMLYKTALARVMSGENGQPSAWTKELLETWKVFC